MRQRHVDRLRKGDQKQAAVASLLLQALFPPLPWQAPDPQAPDSSLSESFVSAPPVALSLSLSLSLRLAWEF